MDLITYLIVLFISFSGTIFGVMLCNIALEEIATVSKHLKYINALLIISMAFIAVLKIKVLYSIIAAVIMAILVLVIKNTHKDRWFYSGSGILLGVSAMYNELMTVSVLAFTYGLSIATSAVSEEIKKRDKGIRFPKNITLAKNIMLKNSGYLIAGIISYVILSIII